MPARYFLPLTWAMLLVPPSVLADPISLQSSTEQSHPGIQPQLETNYSRRVEANPSLAKSQITKQNRVVAQPSQLSKPNHASLLGTPQQIQRPFTSLTTKPNELESTQRYTPKTSLSQSAIALLSTTNSQANDDLSICTRSADSQEQPKDQLLVREFKVFMQGKGSKEPVLQSEINKVLKGCKNRLLTPEQRTSLADAITRLYLNKDYITSRAFVKELKGDDRNGYILTIEVIEGSLERIDVVTVNEKDDKTEKDDETASIGLLAVKPSYVCKRIQSGLGIPLNPLCGDTNNPLKGIILNTRKLEEQVRLLSLDPFIRDINPILKPGAGDGKSVLRLEVKKPRFLNVSFNNYSPPSIGAQRAEIGFLVGSLATDGDIISTSYSVDPLSFSASRALNSFNFGYRLPLSSKDNILQLRLETRREKIVQEPFDQFDFQAESQLYEVVYRHPLLRTYSNEFALSVGFTYQNGQTFVFNDTPFPFGIGPDIAGVSRTSVVKFTQEYIHRGEYVTWAVRSQFNFGTGLFGATRNPDPIPDGKFFSWSGQAQRVQRLFNNLLVIQADVQLSPNSLLPSQQFVIGGGQSLRGYRQNIRFGDNGLRFSTEYRLNLVTRSRDDGTKEPVLQISPFFDAGLVWNRLDNPNRLPKQTFLVGAGAGLLWQTPISGLTVRVDYALPLVDLRDRGDNIQDNGLYFTINYQL
jgi:hemolysin activation/secretion protein